MTDPFGGIDPPAQRINPDYVQQPSNPRKCVKCFAIHDNIVENMKTGERISEIDKCPKCFWENAFKYNPIETQVKFDD